MLKLADWRNLKVLAGTPDMLLRSLKPSKATPLQLALALESIIAVLKPNTTYRFLCWNSLLLFLDFVMLC